MMRTMKKTRARARDRSRRHWRGDPGPAADTYKISGGEVTVSCPLTVGGSFEAKTKTLSGRSRRWRRRLARSRAR